jgi:hypothetical protein
VGYRALSGHVEFWGRELRIVACRVWRARCEPASPSLLCLRPVDERAPSGDGEFGAEGVPVWLTGLACLRVPPPLPR